MGIIVSCEGVMQSVDVSYHVPYAMSHARDMPHCSTKCTTRENKQGEKGPGRRTTPETASRKKQKEGHYTQHDEG